MRTKHEEPRGSVEFVDVSRTSPSRRRSSSTRFHTRPSRPRPQPARAVDRDGRVPFPGRQLQEARALTSPPSDPLRPEPNHLGRPRTRVRPGLQLLQPDHHLLGAQSEGGDAFLEGVGATRAGASGRGRKSVGVGRLRAGSTDSTASGGGGPPRSPRSRRRRGGLGGGRGFARRARRRRRWPVRRASAARRACSAASRLAAPISIAASSADCGGHQGDVDPLFQLGDRRGRVARVDPPVVGRVALGSFAFRRLAFGRVDLDRVAFTGVVADRVALAGVEPDRPALVRVGLVARRRRVRALRARSYLTQRPPSRPM